MAWLERIKRVIETAREGWRHWRTFREIDAGHRYQSRYHFHQRRRRKRLVWRYWQLAGEFLLLARLFDRVGARLGRYERWIRGVWRSSPAAVKILAILAFCALLVYGAHALFAG